MSKFKELFQEANHAEPEPVKTAEKPLKVKTEVAKNKPEGATRAPRFASSDIRRQRVTGKRSNPDYTGVFAYIPVTMHEDVKERLVRKKDLDFSLLVEQLLAKWLKEQK